MKTTETLASVRKGDRIILVHNQSNRNGTRITLRPEIVKSVTNKGICDSSSTWYSMQGFAIRGDRRGFGYSIRMPRNGELDALDQQAHQEQTERERKAQEKAIHEATPEHQLAIRFSYMEHEQWERLPLGELRRILEIVEARI